jgi:hypothetical protein
MNGIGLLNRLPQLYIHVFYKRRETMSIYNIIGIVNSVGIGFIIAINLKIRKESKKKGVWRND